tara:strand:+ start:1270 stop:1533 length:264 start_codon:yes stop_codon:yes gene_type:complete
MSLIINDEYSIEQSFDDKYNLDINECIVSINIYCKDNQLPFLNNFNYNDFTDVLKKNIDFSKIQITNTDEIESSDEEELTDDEYSDY